MLLLAVHPAHAQLGGLKKKVADKVAGKKPDTTVAASGSAKPKCDKSTMVITSDVVDRYLKGMAARDAEIRKIAREPGPIGAYYAALSKRQDTERRKREFDLRRGPDWEKYKVVYPKMVKGDQAAMAQQRALMDSLDPNKVMVPEPDWNAQQAQNQRTDSVAMAAAGIPACDWGGNGIGDRIPMLVSIYANDPNAKDLRGYGTPPEGAAVKARLKDLMAALGYGDRGRGAGAGAEFTEAEKAHIKEEDEKLQRLTVLTGDAYTDCATGVQQAFMKKHQAEFDKLQKQQDMAASQKLSMELMQETEKECKKYSKNKDNDDE
jgi:hypothetical protein